MNQDNAPKISPKISIVTICKNAQGMISKTISSVLDQKYPHLEYILVDGASTDNTLNEVQAFASNLTKVISEPDKGISDAFNKGIKSATGDIVIILNADDTLLPDALQAVAAAHLKNPTAIIYGDILYENASTKISFVAKPNLTKINQMMSIHHLAMFVPRSIYEKMGAYKNEYRVSMDYEFIIRCLQQNISFTYVPFTFGIMTGGGVSFKSWNKSLKEQARVQQDYKLAPKGLITARYYYRTYRDSAIAWLTLNKLDAPLRVYRCLRSSWSKG